MFNREPESQTSHKGFPLVLTIQKIAGANLSSEVFKKVTVVPGLPRAERKEVWRGTTRYSSDIHTILQGVKKGQMCLRKADWQCLADFFISKTQNKKHKT